MITLMVLSFACVVFSYYGASNNNLLWMLAILIVVALAGDFILDFQGKGLMTLCTRICNRIMSLDDQ